MDAGIKSISNLHYTRSSYPEVLVNRMNLLLHVECEGSGFEISNVNSW
jgi:hypothetical protein